MQRLPRPVGARLSAAALVILGAFSLFPSACAAPRREAGPARTGLSLKRLPPMPAAASNNAVAALFNRGAIRLYSFMGLGEGRGYQDILPTAYAFDASRGSWSTLPPVPGGGRLGATAEGVGGRIFLFGGFTVDSRRRENTLARLDIFDPSTGKYTAGRPMPLPVDDTLSAVWRDKLIYLVSGWSGTGNVRDVQYYDPASDRWALATPVPGTPVFGHAGGIVGDTIVYCDGVAAAGGTDGTFRISGDCYRGDINPAEPASISWRRIPRHPGRPRYRMAAGALSTPQALFFAGGADIPYSYSGIGYDGTPASPSGETFLFYPDSNRWERGPDLPVPTMDHRGLAGHGDRLFLAGGMSTGRVVSPGLVAIDTTAPLPVRENGKTPSP